MTRHFLCIILAVSAGIACADVGDLEFVEAPGVGQSRLHARRQQFSKPPADCGTVNEHAMIATLTNPAGGKIMAAIDSRDPGATAPDVVRLNFDGVAKFDDKLVVPLRGEVKPGSNYHLQLLPTALQVRRDDRTIPVAVRGDYYKGSNYRQLKLSLVSDVYGRCAFGDKIRIVHITDGNSNLSYADSPSLHLKKDRVEGRRGSGPSADRVIIYADDGSPRDVAARGLFGQPMLVDGTWYTLSLSDDDMKVSASPADVQTGTIRVDRGRWSALLIGEKHVLEISGTNKPIDVPADRYAIANYREQTVSGTKRDAGILTAGRRVLQGQPVRSTDVPAGEVIDLPVGSPLTGSVAAQRRGRKMTFRLKLVDVGGSDVDYLTLANGQRPPPPKIEVLDDQGQQVYQATLKYG